MEYGVDRDAEGCLRICRKMPELRLFRISPISGQLQLQHCRSSGATCAFRHTRPLFDGSRPLVTVDGFSHFVQAIRTMHIGTAQAVKELTKWMDRLGPIQELCGDNASSWNSAFFSRWTGEMQIKAPINSKLIQLWQRGSGKSKPDSSGKTVVDDEWVQGSVDRGG